MWSFHLKCLQSERNEICIWINLNWRYLVPVQDRVLKKNTKRARFTLNKFTVLSLQLYIILSYPKCGPSFHQPVNCALSQDWLKTDICMNTLKHWQLRHDNNNFIAGNLKSCNWITFEPTLVAVECNLSPISQEKHVL